MDSITLRNSNVFPIPMEDVVEQMMEKFIIPTLKDFEPYYLKLGDDVIYCDDELAFVSTIYDPPYRIFLYYSKSKKKLYLVQIKKGNTDRIQLHEYFTYKEFADFLNLKDIMKIFTRYFVRINWKEFGRKEQSVFSQEGYRYEKTLENPIDS